MFVFPAGDKAYRSRKRVLKSCERCRLKRIKCLVPPHLKECQNCQDATASCSFAPKNAWTLEKKTLEAADITAEFLKKQFNFSISTLLEDRRYLYVYHDHPKVIVNSKIDTDKTLYYESGIHVDYHISPKKKQQYHIRDMATYKYLVAINAFSITSGKFALYHTEIRQLVSIFFDKIHTVFPIVNYTGFWEEWNADILPSVLLFVIILVALKDPSAAPIMDQMLLRNKKPEESNEDLYIEWSTLLETKIRQLLIMLPQLGDFDKLTIISSLLLLSLHCGFHQFGNENSNQDLSNAISVALLLGIHMKRQLKEIPQERIRHTEEQWWVLFILDKFNTFVNCRTTLIKMEDFNLDLPKNVKLLKLIQVAQSLEDMLHDLYRPFKRNHSLKMRETYKTDKFQELEFETCENEMKLPPDKLDTSTVHFLTRIIQNTVILAAQKAKYEDTTIPNNIPEGVAFRASQNILWYFKHQPAVQIINIPIVPWCLTLALGVSLKRRAQIVVNYKDLAKDIDFNVKELYSWKDFISVLQGYSQKYWVVDENCKLCTEFGNKLELKHKNLKQNTIEDHQLEESLNKMPDMGFAPYDDFFGGVPLDMFSSIGLIDFPNISPQFDGSAS